LTAAISVAGNITVIAVLSFGKRWVSYTFSRQFINDWSLKSGIAKGAREIWVWIFNLEFNVNILESLEAIWIVVP
jgi:hypothetical protein